MTILKCDKCQEDMRLLQEHKIVGDQYLCLKCAVPAQTENAVKEFYDNLGDTSIGWLGYHKRPEYKSFLGKFNYLGTTTTVNFYKGIIDPGVSPFAYTIDVFGCKILMSTGIRVMITCDKSMWWIHHGFSWPIYWSDNFSDSHVQATLASY